jgi:hypothetical protein
MCSKLAFMAAGEPELCTSSPFSHLRHSSVTAMGNQRLLSCRVA